MHKDNEDDDVRLAAENTISELRPKNPFLHHHEMQQDDPTIENSEKQPLHSNTSYHEDDEDTITNEKERHHGPRHFFNQYQEEANNKEEELKKEKQALDDDDDEFDWNDDPDTPRPKRRKTTKQKIQEAMRRPCCWSYLSPFAKRVILALVGSCIFITPAVLVNQLLPVPTEEERADPNFKNVRSNLQLWLYWAASLHCAVWIVAVLVESVPAVVSLWTKVFKGRRSEKVKTAMEYYMSLKRYLMILILASWNWGSWAFLLDYPYNSVKTQGYSAVITKVFACIFVASCWLFVQKIVVQFIATRFHREAFSDRLRDNKYALKILDTLSKSEARKSRPETNGLRSRRPNSGGSDKSNSSHDDRYSTSSYTTSYSHGNNNHYNKTNNKHHAGAEIFGQFQKRIQNIVLTDQPQIRSKIDRNKVDINSIEYAKKVAKKLFYSLAYPHHAGMIPSHIPQEELENSKTSLDLSHFEPYFPNGREEAERAFAVFDRDGNGNLTRREFRDTVLQIYKERKALSQSMRDTGQALGKIDTMLLLISIVATVFISLGIFHVDLWQALVPLGSFLLALTFIFGNSCKNTFESVMFLFVTHPYDAGDYLLIDDQFLLVHELGLMGTVFIRGDGQQVYAPTTVLMTKLIVNVRRSGDMGESIVMNIDFRTPTERLKLFHKRLAEWVNGESRDYAPGFDVRVTDIIDVNQIILTMWLPHKGNWQDLGRRFQRRTKFMIAVKDLLTELDIRYELPAQRFTQSMGEKAFLSEGHNNNNSNNMMSVTPQSFAQGSQAVSVTNGR
ncbi:Mechanosensitive ion channel-domain-containing protein [Phascolomyces articulosus]|uniref:Mechanosensitive ion channel-domain-containing protein n=1 Tax=Phascolomyces articulosus TaxID=60185 RepID=A0AAD5PKY8_9FUNG|nr:Mechanosensitive ion channel-domain-containing protein [Phascolomyces articulosus]